LNFVRIKLLEIVGDKFFFYPNIYCKGCKSRILDFFGIVGDALSPKIKEKRPKKQIHLFRQADRQWAGGSGGSFKGFWIYEMSRASLHP
jgi:hypothetical protein